MEEFSDNADYEVKLVLVGDSGVGKSNILSRYTRNEFNIESKTTIGVAFEQIHVEIDKRIIRLQIWDTSGQERFEAIVSSYYRRATGALLVYDMTKRSTFESLDTWLKEIRLLAEPNAVIILVGNKSDLKHLRAITKDEGADYAERNGLLFIETSALASENIEEAFAKLASKLFETLKQKPPKLRDTRGRLSEKKDPLSIFCKCL
mmetsp:Transcript_45093/g.52155  ORF Transcript_45093/g.52155 Transcript_45093/m.52155 type:complete len:205 (-) Transcript_45093:66-680(-)